MHTDDDYPAWGNLGSRWQPARWELCARTAPHAVKVLGLWRRPTLTAATRTIHPMRGLLACLPPGHDQPASLREWKQRRAARHAPRPTPWAEQGALVLSWRSHD